MANQKTQDDNKTIQKRTVLPHISNEIRLTAWKNHAPFQTGFYSVKANLQQEECR